MSGLFELRKAIPVMVVLIVLAIVVGRNAVTQYMTSNQEVRRGYFVADMATSLRQSSDDLTRMARLYAITGDPLYREYFREILDIRNGEAPRPERYYDIPYWDVVLASGERPTAAGETASMRSMIVEMGGATADELALLTESEDQSNALAVLEQEVFDTVAALADAGGGDYVLEGDALAAMLRLHGAEYHDAKGKIMAPLNDLHYVMEDRLFAQRDAIIEALDQNVTLMTVLLALALLLGAGVLVKARRS